MGYVLLLGMGIKYIYVENKNTEADTAKFLLRIAKPHRTLFS